MESWARRLVLIAALFVDSSYEATVNALDFTAAVGCSDLHLKCSFTTDDTEEGVDLTWTNGPGPPIYTMDFKTRKEQFPPEFSFGISKHDNFTKGDITFPKVNVKKDMAGNYQCRYRTNVTTVSSTAMVKIQYGPTSASIVKTSATNTVEHTTLTLSCRATSNPAPHIYTWSGPGVTRNSRILIVTNIKRTANGTYTCSATSTLKPTEGSSCDVKKSASYAVHVFYHDTPTLTISQLNPKEGAPFVITCETQSDPLATVNVTPSILGATRTTSANKSIIYRVQHATCSQSSYYRCKSKNSKTNDEKMSNGKTVNVLCIPRKSSSSRQPVTLKIHQVAKFTIYVIAYPLPNFTWFQRDARDTLQPIKSNAIPSSNSLRTDLTINVTSPEDYGVYTVISANSEGKVTIANFTLLSNVKPFNIEEFRILNSSTDSIFMQWLSPFDGGNPQTFSFQFASEQDHNQSIWSTKHVLLSDPGRYQTVTGGIFDLYPGRTYFFRIVAKNSQGSVTSNVLNATTIELPGDQNGSMSVGMLIGFGTCICVAVIVILAWVIYRYKIKPARDKGVSSDADHCFNAVEIPKQKERTNDAERIYENSSTKVQEGARADDIVSSVSSDADKYYNAAEIRKQEARECDAERIYENSSKEDLQGKPRADDIAMGSMYKTYEHLEKKPYEQPYTIMALKPDKTLGAYFKSTPNEKKDESIYVNSNSEKPEDGTKKKKVWKKKKRKIDESHYANVKVQQ